MSIFKKILRADFDITAGYKEPGYSLPRHGNPDEGDDYLYDVREDGYFKPILAALRKHYPDATQRLSVLQIASGYGQLGTELEEENAEPILMDISQSNIRWGKKHGTFGGICANAVKIPLKDNSVDLAVSDHFIYANYWMVQYGEEQAIVDEVLRVLKDDGILMLYHHHLQSSSFHSDAPYLAQNFNLLEHETYRICSSLLIILQKKTKDGSPSTFALKQE
ncbi:Methyltransferase domain protein [uncultured archaeon]|nr:Methyltransferase domain protein [uncultured archaeon]